MSILAKFVPDQIAGGLLDIDLGALKAAGVRGVLVDIDNTLAPWDSTEVAGELQEWVKQAGQVLKVCVLSNSSKRTRVRKLAQLLGVPCVWPAGKPWPIAFRRALALTGTAPDETVMIGDQLFTDILGANLYGLRTILVRPLGTNEFIGTKLTRLVERVVIWLLHRRGLMPQEATTGGRKWPGARRCADEHR